MKRGILISVIIYSFCIGSCEKNVPVTCNVENPQENIEWLKEIVEKADTLIHLEIYSFNYENKELLLINEEGFGMYIKNCCGELVCHEGDLEGDCSKAIFHAASNKKLIFECNSNN